MYDPLFMDVPQGAAQFGHPEPYRLFSEGLPGNMESKVSAVHKIHDNVPRELLDKTKSGRVFRILRTNTRCLENCNEDYRERDGSDVPACVALG